MGIIGNVKLIYCALYLFKLLEIFNEGKGCERGAEIIMNQKSGYKGIDFGKKQNRIDAMELFESI